MKNIASWNNLALFIITSVYVWSVKPAAFVCELLLFVKFHCLLLFYQSFDRRTDGIRIIHEKNPIFSHQHCYLLISLNTENLTPFLNSYFQMCGKVFSKMCSLKVHKLKHEQDRFRSEFFKTGKVGKLPWFWLKFR